MTQRAVRLSLGVIVVLLLSEPLWADPQADFENLFGSDAKKALATPDTRDDADLAATLLKAAQAATASPDLQALLCEKAYEFGVKNVAGCPTAIEAMRLLAEKSPARKTHCQEKILTAAQTFFARSTGPAKQKAGEDLLTIMVDLADDKVEVRKSAEAAAIYQRAVAVSSSIRSDRTGEIQSKIRDAQSRQRIDQRYDSLKARLEKDPQDADSRNALLLLAVVEYDDIAEASKLLNQDIDETLRTYVPMAAKSLEETPEAACLELAEWYRKLDSDASPRGRQNILTRARNYYSRFLESHTGGDAPQLMARKGLSETDEALRALEEKLAGPDGGLSALLREVKVVSQGHNVGDRLMIAYKGKTIIDASSGQGTTGLTLVTIRNGQTSQPVTFDTCGSRQASDRFADTVAAVPAGTLVILAVRHDGATSFTQRAQDAIRSIGGKIGLLNQPQLNSYFCIGRKGLAPGGAVERNSNKPLAYPPDAAGQTSTTSDKTPKKPDAPRPPDRTHRPTFPGRKGG